MIPPQAGPPPVSYSIQVAPILALHCNGCHGAAGGLSTRGYAELMAGGSLGRSIIPGDAEGSLLVQFVEGRRGRERRMPLAGAPLSAAQIATIRRWIQEGASQDADSSKKHRFTLSNVRVDRSKLLEVFCRVDSPSYLILTLIDPGKKRPLHSEVASIKAPKEAGDAGSPGELIRWGLRPGRKWPRRITVELTVAYAEREPRGTEFFARTADPVSGRHGKKRTGGAGTAARYMALTRTAAPQSG